jgi:hypothetical protein
MGLVVWQAPHYTFAIASTSPMMGLRWLLGDPDVRFLVIELTVAFLGLIAFIEHYAARLTAVFFVLLIQSIPYLRGWRHRGRPVGIGLSPVVILFVAGTFPVLVAHAIRNSDSVPPVTPQWSRSRARIEAQLEHTPGQPL